MPPVRVPLPEDLTSFVGRSEEVRDARARLGSARLVTLVGPGGIGKSRLALSVARACGKAFSGGAVVIDLDSARRPPDLAQAAVAALGLRDQSARDPVEQLADHLAARSVLLVLDGCEHVLDAAGQLAVTLLRSAPGLRVLATSREALAVEGESTYVVPPLATPDPDNLPPPARLRRIEAVSLLLERGAAVRSGFAISEGNARDVAELCARLDGLPLAIELAAVRLRSLTPGEIVARLDDRFELLTDGNRAAVPRQQTLRALIDWSWDLCTPEDRELWRRLSVFPGSFDLEAAEAVCGGAMRVDAGLDQLVAKSVVVAETDGDHVRHRQLASLREYGAERLASEAREDLEAAHARHYRDRARSMAAEWAGPDQVALLARMRADHPNLRSALAACLASGDAVTAADLAVALRYHWIVGGHLSEGRRWLERIRAATSADDARRGDLLWVTSWIAMLQGDLSDAETLLDEAGVLAAATGDDRLAAHVAHWRGLAALFHGDTAAAVTSVEQGLRGHDDAGDDAARLTALFQLAAALAYAGRGGEARAACARALELSAARQERWARAYVHWADALVAWTEGRFDDAERSATEAIRPQVDFLDGVCTGLAVEVLAWVAAERGAVRRAARLLAAADGVWRQIGSVMRAFGPHMLADAQACAQRVVAEAEPRELAGFAAGATGVEAAIELVLGPAEGPVQATILTPREREIATLVAQGVTNRAIAERLVLSPRTVDNHVARILARLGFGSRAQIARWVVEQETTSAAG